VAATVRVDFSRSTALIPSPRATQVEGMFGMEPATSIERQWSVDMPLDGKPWAIGLVVGPSGSGKTTVLEEVFDHGVSSVDAEWPSRSAVIDGFEDEIDTDDIVRTLTGVGFSSPPAWLRPWGTLSTGEQFRADLARTLLWARLSGSVAVVDEFTSTVDRTVAKTASVAVSKLLRVLPEPGKLAAKPGEYLFDKLPRMVAASCHYDIIDWLQPDWLLDMAAGTFTWRSLHPRPRILLDLRRASHAEWAPFAPHHYLNPGLSKRAHCYLGTVEGRPATFTGVLPTPSPRGYVVARESRTVCLPDFQGVGLGHVTADTIAAGYRAAGWRYRSTTSHPAMIGHRARSPLWDMVRAPSFEHDARTSAGTLGGSSQRRTATFEFVGPPNPEAAEVLDVPRFSAPGGPSTT
jgi:hypothetical protein